MNNEADASISVDTNKSRSRGGGIVLIGGVALIGIVLLAVFYYGILNPPTERVGSGQAPAISFTTFDDQEIHLTDYRGTPVIVNFWASWCNPCRQEQAALEAAWRKYQGEVMFLGLAYLDQVPNALAYLDEFDVTYPNGPDRGSRAYTAYKVQGVPETWFIDRAGNVQSFHVGPLTAAELERQIQQLLTQ